MKESQNKGFYEFGEFRLDLRARRLMRAGGEIVPLTPKEFELLLLLVENAGEVVEKNELLDKLWADTFVEETTLMRNVSWLRKKLAAAGGSGDERLIETLPKRGYRFLGEVRLRREDDALLIEEQTVRRIVIEDTVSIADCGLRIADCKDKAELPAVSDHRLKTIDRKANSQFAIRNSQLIWFAFGVLALAAIAFVVYQRYAGQSQPRVIAATKIVPFSGLPGREAMPAFSPDGKMLAFAWNGGEDRDFDVYVKFIGAGDPVRLTRSEADDVHPTFAPDGKSIVFVRSLSTRSEVFSVPALGGAERKICDLRPTATGVSFSPDGRFLAVSDGDETDRQSGIFLVNVETGEKRRLTAPPALAGDDRPAFAPDGKSIAFIRNFGQVFNELFVLPFPAGDAPPPEPRQLTFDKKWIRGAAWSAANQKIIFASLRKYNSRANLWQIASTGGEPEVIATGSKSLSSPAISPDGRIVAFVEDSMDANIRFIKPAENGAASARRKFAASSRNDHSPTFAPDGSRVAFASDRTGNYEIWIADADGSNARQLTDLRDAHAGSPRFSPDGKAIAFDAQIGGNGDIYVISADAAAGAPPRRVTDSPSFDFIPAWSADGNSLYFASERSGTAQIYQIPASGGETRQITEKGGRECYASSDGKYLYYTKNKDNPGLWRVAAGGGDEQSVPELAEAGYWRYWTLTPAGIYFAARSESPPYKIMFYDFSIRQTAEIAATDSAPVWVYPGLGASADGKTLLFSQSDQNASSIMLAELAR